VSTLEKLKSANSLSDLANLMGVRPSALSYIIYKLSDDQKYSEFDIPKKSGGVRKIRAPHPELKMLQRRLANLLYNCRDDIDEQYDRKPLSHGFRKRHSIITNARPHKRRRYVLNLDIENYFPSFNFGRVRGYFIKNRDFALHDKVATVIAQIACFDNELPQGSPCSPVIAELVTHPMDVRLAQLAKRHSLTYTRYADDLTFSTSKAEFPTLIATIDGQDGSKCVLGNPLMTVIGRAGFAVNQYKTRMQVRTTRQSVTGLTVNAKVNVPADYYRYARAMCHSAFTTGAYFRPEQEDEPITSLSPLEGILSYIHYVKHTVDPRDHLTKIKEPTAARNLYKRFLFYKHFVRLERPLIICEGKTDNVYLKYAIRALTKYHPKLGQFSDSSFESAVSFFNYANRSGKKGSQPAHQILQINGGTGGLKHLLLHYKKSIQTFAHRPLLYPVIMLVDNDSGAAQDIFGACRGNFNTQIDLNTTDNFYLLTDNLYLVKTPEAGQGQHTCIEDLFEPQLLQTQLDGKSFNPNNEQDSTTEYGKHVFAEKVVRPNAGAINFAGFDPLIERITDVIDSYTPPA